MALNCKKTFDAFADAGVGFFTGVPDSLLKHFCAYVTSNTKPEEHVIAANEGASVALAAGHYFATEKPALVYLQNSGLGNCINPLTSLADPAVYGVPMLVMVGWRGEPEKKDQPQHVLMGSITREVFGAIGMPFVVLPTEQREAGAAIAKAAAQALREKRPVGILVRKGSFDSSPAPEADGAALELSREQAIGLVLDGVGAKAAIVSTTGMPSREVFEQRVQRGETHDRDFLTVGSMGHASAIALGVALARPNKDVVCLDGDGAAIMHLGNLGTIGALGPVNYKHVVINNGAHDSVGGQPTIGFDIDFCAIARGCGYKSALVARNEIELTAAITAMMKAKGPAFVEVHVRRGARADLGRPTRSPIECKDSFMGFLQK